MIVISSHVTNKNLEVWIIVTVFNKTCLYICFAMIHLAKSLKWCLIVFGTFKKLKSYFSASYSNMGHPCYRRWKIFPICCLLRAHSPLKHVTWSKID
jgi:hypothetical protein